MVRAALRRGLDVIAWAGSADVPLHDPARAEAAFRQARPSAVLHLAAMARIDACQRDPDLARRINACVPALLARLCAEAKAHLVLVSTDMVFDGTRAPYGLRAEPSPQSVYAQTKVEGERLALGATVARLPLLVGPSLSGARSFFGDQARHLRDGVPISLYEDEWRTPMDLPTAAAALVELALARAGGLWHLAGPERLSRLEMGAALAQVLGASPALLVAAKRPADRPRDLSLDPSTWREAFPRLPWPTLAQALPGLLAR